MKITFVSQNYLPFTGGIEMHVAQLAQSLSERHDVTIASMNFRSFVLPHRLAPLAANLLAERNGCDRTDRFVKVLSLAPDWIARLKMLPLLWRSFPLIPRWFYHAINRVTHPFYAWAFRRRLSSAICNADIVHIMGALDLGWAAQSVAFAHHKHVVCTPFVHPRQWGDGSNDVAYYRRCDAIVGLIASDSDYLSKLGIPLSKLHTIGVSPCLPQTNDPEILRQELSLENEPIILYIGRMVAEKGAKVIIDATPMVWRSYPNARFVFIGPGNDNDIKVFKNCDSRIQYLGRVSDQVKGQALAACTMLCMPSISEILPTVYLEAWSLGKPVIGGTAHGLQDLVEGNNAGITVSQTPQATAEAIIRLLSDANLARSLGDNGRQLVSKKYSTEAVLQMHENLYEFTVHSSKLEP